MAGDCSLCSSGSARELLVVAGRTEARTFSSGNVRLQPPFRRGISGGIRTNVRSEIPLNAGLFCVISVPCQGACKNNGLRFIPVNLLRYLCICTAPYCDGHGGRDRDAHRATGSRSDGEWQRDNRTIGNRRLVSRANVTVQLLPGVASPAVAAGDRPSAPPQAYWSSLQLSSAAYPQKHPF